MTQPWYPQPNPGGPTRRMVRISVQEWLSAQMISGLDAVWAFPRRVAWEEGSESDGPDFSAQATVSCPRFRDTYGASTGPDDPGGVLRHYDAVVRIFHRQHVGDDWQAGQDDYDRIIDLIVNSLHGNGRNLDRPDTILQAGTWPPDEMISVEDEEPIQDQDEGGPVDRWGTISFTVSVYFPTKYP